MSASPFARSDIRTDRTSDVPIAMDLGAGARGGSTGSTFIDGLVNRVPPAWLGMSGYLAAGVVLGLILIVGLTLTRSDSKPTASAGVITDNVVHLQNAELAPNCFRGASTDGPSRLTVSLEVGLDGKVRNAVAAGESPSLRSCVESHVKAWEFLPQASSSQMVLPFEIDPR